MDEIKTFEGIYKKQIEFQKKINELHPYEFPIQNIPEDNIHICSYHIQQLISEIGEVLSADKRWKNFRNEKLDIENKKEEIADCFIVLMNIAIYSGMSAKDLESSICNKIDENFKRFE